MRILLRIFGVGLILSAIVLFFWQDIREYFTDQVNDRMIEAFENGEDSVDVNAFERFITGIEAENSADSGTSDSSNSNTAQASSIELGDNLAAIISIPSADINEPVFKGPVTEENMRNGVSLVSETDHIDMQNLPIAGHRVEGAGIRFNYLDRAEVGDDIYLKTRDGERHYKITEIFTVMPTQVDVLDQNEGNPQELTLITCDSYNPETLMFEERMIVKAEIQE